MNKNYEITKAISPEEYMKMREAVGWGFSRSKKLRQASRILTSGASETAVRR